MGISIVVPIRSLATRASTLIWYFTAACAVGVAGQIPSVRPPGAETPGTGASELHGGWKRLYESGDGSAVWYYTRQQSSGNGDRVKLWRRIEYRAAQPVEIGMAAQHAAYRSLAEQVVVDCVAMNERTLRSIAYRSPGLVDPLDAGARAASHPSIAPPDASSGDFARRVCPLFQPRRMRPQ
jgi:hypothetical protein